MKERLLKKNFLQIEEKENFILNNIELKIGL